MNWITKAFVLLVTALSVVLVSMLVPFVVNTENYRQQLELAEQVKQAAIETAKQRGAEINALEAAESKRIIQLASEKQTLMSEISNLEQEVANAQAARQSEAARANQAQAENSRLTAVMQQQGQIMGALQSELRDRRKEMLDQQRRAIELADQNNQLTSELETFNREVRRLQEQMVALEQRNSNLENMLSRVPEDIRRDLRDEEGRVDRVAYVPDTIIRGQVTRLDTEQGELFLEINVGDRDGVGENMRFWVHRGDQFLGTMVITAVNPRASAGKVELVQGEIQPGDEVLTGGL